MDQYGIWRPTDRDVKMAPTHGDIETIGEKLAYRKYIIDSEFETREVFEQETSNQNIENIGTRLETIFSIFRFDVSCSNTFLVSNSES